MKRKDLDKVYDAYHRAVLHAAYDVLQDYDLAQRVCQEVFVEYYKKMGKIGRRRVKGWLLGCAQEKAVGYREGSHGRGKVAAGEKKEQELISEWKMEN